MQRARAGQTLKEIIVAIGDGRGFQFVIKAKRSFRRIILLCILLLIAVVEFLLQRDSSESIAPVTLLDGPFTISAAPRDRFTMTLGPNKRWVARAEQALFGERKPVQVSAEITKLTGLGLTNVESTLKLPAPTFATNGLKIWFLSAARLKEISARSSPTNGIEVLSRPRIVTADGIVGSMFMGQSMPTKGGMMPVGFGMKSAALVHDESIVLLTEIMQSEFGDGAVQTNFAINARLNVPNGKGVFLVQQPNGGATNGWGLVIHPLR